MWYWASVSDEMDLVVSASMRWGGPKVPVKSDFHVIFLCCSSSGVSSLIRTKVCLAGVNGREDKVKGFSVLPTLLMWV